MNNLEEIKNKITKSKSFFTQEYGVKEIAIFGSYSRNEQTSNSDIDILVDFNKPIGLKFVNLSDDLEKTLGIKTHLVSKNALKNNFKNIIEQDLIYV